MDFAYSAEQQELYEAARKFAESKLSEGVIERDKNHEFSRELWDACADFGLQGIAMPEEHGGMGLDPISQIAILEGAGYGCRDNGMMFSVNAHIWASEIPIAQSANAELKEKYLPKMISGEYIGANAMTEPDTGSDVYSLRTTAKKEKDYYVLDGSKTFITNAPVADVFVTYARTKEVKGFAGLSCFIIDRDTEGMTIGKGLDKMGLRTSPMAEMYFSNCKVPAAHLVGKENNGAMIFANSMEYERLFILASCIGSMQYWLDQCIKYAKMRKVGGKPISKYSAVADKIVEMRIRVETSRLLLQKAAWIRAKKSATVESAMVKTYVSQSYVQNCRDALQILGGYGYMVEYEIERELRDALASTIYSGTSEVQKAVAAGLMGL